MAITLLPGFHTLSEFGQYHGDCGECATLGVLHCLNPDAFPLTLSELNHLTSDAIAHGEADASLSGGMNVPHLDAMLSRLGIAHTTVGYGSFTLDGLHAALKANAGHHGVIVEWSKGGALPGDESGVQYHYSSCGGIDTGPAGDGIGGGYFWCDGDNSASTKTDGGDGPIKYTWADVQNAAPIAYIVITAPVAAPTPPPPPPPPPPAPTPAPDPDVAADAALVAQIAALKAALSTAQILGGVNVASFRASLTAAKAHADNLSAELQAAINSLPVGTN